MLLYVDFITMFVLLLRTHNEQNTYLLKNTHTPRREKPL
jgi:hypothetical protein